MIVLRFEDMSAQERGELLAVGVFPAPALTTFMVAAAQLGLPDTVEACRARELPSAVVDKLAGTGLDATKLPSAEDAERFLMGLRIYVQRKPTRTRVGKINKVVRPQPLVTVAQGLGLTVLEAHACLRAFYALTGKTPPSLTDVHQGEDDA